MCRENQEERGEKKRKEKKESQPSPPSLANSAKKPQNSTGNLWPKQKFNGGVVAEKGGSSERIPPYFLQSALENSKKCQNTFKSHIFPYPLQVTDYHLLGSWAQILPVGKRNETRLLTSSQRPPEGAGFLAFPTLKAERCPCLSNHTHLSEPCPLAMA